MSVRQAPAVRMVYVCGVTGLSGQALSFVVLPVKSCPERLRDRSGVKSKIKMDALCSLPWTLKRGHLDLPIAPGWGWAGLGAECYNAPFFNS